MAGTASDCSSSKTCKFLPNAELRTPNAERRAPNALFAGGFLVSLMFARGWLLAVKNSTILHMALSNK